MSFLLAKSLIRVQSVGVSSLIGIYNFFKTTFRDLQLAVMRSASSSIIFADFLLLTEIKMSPDCCDKDRHFIAVQKKSDVKASSLTDLSALISSTHSHTQMFALTNSITFEHAQVRWNENLPPRNNSKRA